jgi:hypothetical protein
VAVGVVLQAVILPTIKTAIAALPNEKKDRAITNFLD